MSTPPPSTPKTARSRPLSTPPPAPKKARKSHRKPTLGPLPVELFPSVLEVPSQKECMETRWRQDFKRALYNSSKDEAQKMTMFLFGDWSNEYTPAKDYLEPLCGEYWSYDCIVKEECEAFREIEMAYQRALRRLSARRVLFLDMLIDHKVGVFGLNDQILSFAN